MGDFTSLIGTSHITAMVNIVGWPGMELYEASVYWTNDAVYLWPLVHSCVALYGLKPQNQKSEATENNPHCYGVGKCPNEN